MNQRLKYLFLVIMTIILGLISRKLPILPPIIGDVLWGAMVFFSLRVIWVKGSQLKVFLACLFICYVVEFSQLIQVAWLNDLRRNRFGHLILGQGFLLSDLLAYTIGGLLAVGTERFLGMFDRHPSR